MLTQVQSSLKGIFDAHTEHGTAASEDSWFLIVLVLLVQVAFMFGNPLASASSATRKKADKQLQMEIQKLQAKVNRIEANQIATEDLVKTGLTREVVLRKVKCAQIEHHYHSTEQTTAVELKKHQQDLDELKTKYELIENNQKLLADQNEQAKADNNQMEEEISTLRGCLGTLKTFIRQDYSCWQDNFMEKKKMQSLLDDMGDFCWPADEQVQEEEQE